MAPVVAAAIIGAGATLASTASNLYSAYKENKNAAAAKETANRQISAWQNEANNILNEMDANRVRLSGDGDVETYKGMRDSYDQSKYVVDVQPFDKSVYSVEDYLNQNREAILADVTKQVLHTNTGLGLGHSSGAYEAIAKNVLDKDTALYDQAYSRMKDERSFDYGAYTDYIEQQQKKMDSMQQGYLNQMGLLRDDIRFDQEQTDASLQNRLSLGNAIAQSRAQLV